MPAEAPYLLRTGRLRPSRVQVGSPGFTFLELLVVLAIVTVLFALSAGFLRSIGQDTLLAQARAILHESAYRCQNASVGAGRRAVLRIESEEDSDGNPHLVVSAAVARPVFTHQFESLQEAEGGTLTGRLMGTVTRDETGGHTGTAAVFTDGAWLEFPRLSRFAMTEGLEIELWVAPAPDRQAMTLLTTVEEVYHLGLVQPRGGAGYDVRLRLHLLALGESRSTATPTLQDLSTVGGPVAADGRWHRIQVSYHGVWPEIRVDGLVQQLSQKTPVTGSSPRMRLAIPAEGSVALKISDSTPSFVGRMDSFQLRGVFRADEVQRVLPGPIEADRMALPVEVAWVNGVLDPGAHATDVVLAFRDSVQPGDPSLVLRLGLHGTIDMTLGEPHAPGASSPPGVSERGGRP